MTSSDPARARRIQRDIAARVRIAMRNAKVLSSAFDALNDWVAECHDVEEDEVLLCANLLSTVPRHLWLVTISGILAYLTELGYPTPSREDLLLLRSSLESGTDADVESWFDIQYPLK